MSGSKKYSGKNSKKNNKTKSVILVQWYIEALLFAGPLIVTDNYANITATKSWFFIILTGAACISLLCVIRESRRYFKLNPPVLCAAGFVLLSFVSALFSSYGAGCFTGSDGRSMGVIFFAFAAVSLLILTNVPVKNSFLIPGIFITEAVVVIIAMLNFTGVDFLGLVSAVPKFAQGRYLSTIGYSSFLSEYVSMITVMEIVALIQPETNVKGRSKPASFIRKYALFPALFLSYSGLLISDSSGGFVGVVFALSLFPFFFQEKGWIGKASLALVPLPFSCMFSKLLYRYTVLDDTYVAIDPIVKALMRWPVISALFVIAALALLLYNRSRKASTETENRGKTIQLEKWYGIVYSAAVILLLLAVILSNTGIINSPLTITDSFASNRGYIWKEAARLYGEMPLKNKFFGIGPDELLPYFKDMLGTDAMMKASGQVFDSAHNFILHYLLTIGLLAVILMVTGICLGLKKMVKGKKDISFIFLFPFFCYLIQALFVPSTPIILPIALTCFAVGYQRNCKTL